MITDETLMELKTGKLYKILCTRSRWIDLYEIKSGKIITKCGETLTEDFRVVVV